MTLNEVMKETADAIREKTGKSELIAPVNFAEEIKSIPVGGGESGGSTIEYLDVSGLDYTDYYFLFGMAIMAKMPTEKGIFICPISMLLLESKTYLRNMTALGVDLDIEITFPPLGVTTPTKIKDISALMDSFASVPRITEEQFYDLNA